MPDTPEELRHLSSWSAILARGWPYGAGAPPTPEAVAQAITLGASPGTKVGLAWAMYCRPEGATQVEVRIVCGGPQLNKATDAARRGAVAFLTRKRDDGLTAYFLRPTTAGVQKDSGRVPTDSLANSVAKARIEAHAINDALSTVSSTSSHVPRSQLVTKITIPAARVRQGDLTIYTTSLRVEVLVADGFYSVETLDPEDPSDQGYQRLLNRSRAKKLADYILKGQDRKDAFLPTSVFLATAKHIEFSPSENSLTLDTSIVCPLSVVDSQHRLEGLKLAAEKDPRVLDFEVPVNIAANLSRIAQM